MHRYLLNKFFNSRNGGIAPIFALLITAIMLIIGISVDMRRAQNAVVHVQTATDSAVLAAAREYITSGDLEEDVRRAKASEVANDYFAANLSVGGSNVENAGITLTFNAGGEIEASATGEMDMLFGWLIGKATQRIPANSAAIAGDSRRVDVILVLDNSTSMFREDRMVKLRSAAKNFVDTMFNNAEGPNTIQIGVVPWATTVNISSERPLSWDNAPGSTTVVDAAGSRTIPKSAFDDRSKYLYEPWTYTGFYDTDQMDIDYGPVDWRGCITAASDERRVNSYGHVLSSLTDTPVVGMRWPALLEEPEIEEIYVEYEDSHFEDDDDDDDREWQCLRRRKNGRCKKWGYASLSPNSGGEFSSTFVPETSKILDLENLNGQIPEDLLVSSAAVTPIRPDGGSVDGCKDPDKNPTVDANICQLHNYVQPRDTQCREGDGCSVIKCTQDQTQWGSWYKGYRNVWMPHDLPCSTEGDEIQTGNVSACVSDPNEFSYFANGGEACPWQPESDFLPWNSTGRYVSSPNRNCPSAMLGMSQSRPQIFDKLNHLYPAPGGTHADVGLMWGLRMLSDKQQWKSFFGYTTDNEPKGFEAKRSRPIMIMLTDGKNEAPYHFAGYYGCNEEESPYDSHSGRRWTGDCQRSVGINQLSNESLNNLMMDACNAINGYGVELYTIALDLNSDNEEEANHIALLEECAGSSERAFNIRNDELDETFQSIAARTLRLSK